MLRWPNFCRSIRSKEILARGRSCFQNGQVQVTQILGRGKFCCIIQSENSEMDTVNITILNNKVTRYICTCAYRSGPCKHIVAALLDIKQNFIDQANANADNEEGMEEGNDNRNNDNKVDEDFLEINDDEPIIFKQLKSPENKAEAEKSN